MTQIVGEHEHLFKHLASSVLNNSSIPGGTVAEALTNLASAFVRQKKVIDIVDASVAPPTEVLGDRYILDTTGPVNAAWDGALNNDIVEFNGTSWVAYPAQEGRCAYVDLKNNDALFVDDGTPAWELIPTKTTYAITEPGSDAVVPTEKAVVDYIDTALFRQPPVDTFSDLLLIASPKIGETRRVLDVNKVYSYNGTIRLIEGSGPIVSGAFTNDLGNRDANTNTPNITSGIGTLGDRYTVSVAGTTTIDGISERGIGDYIRYDGTKRGRVNNQVGTTAGSLLITDLTIISNIQNYTNRDNLGVYSGTDSFIEGNYYQTESFTYLYFNGELKRFSTNVIQPVFDGTDNSIKNTLSSQLIFITTDDPVLFDQDFYTDGQRVLLYNVSGSSVDVIFSNYSTVQLSDGYDSITGIYSLDNNQTIEFVCQGGNRREVGNSVLEKRTDDFSTKVGFEVPTSNNIINFPNGSGTLALTKLGEITTVGVGGEYLNVASAIAAGKYNLKLISDVTEVTTSGIVWDSNLSIFSDKIDTTRDTGANLVGPTALNPIKKAYFFNFTHSFANIKPMQNCEFYLENFITRNLSTVAGNFYTASTSVTFKFNHRTFYCPNVGTSGIDANTGITATKIGTNIHFVGGGTACSNYMINGGSGNCQINGFRISGTRQQSTNLDFPKFLLSNVTNLVSTSTYTDVVLQTNCSQITLAGANSALSVRNSSAGTYSNLYVNGSFYCKQATAPITVMSLFCTSLGWAVSPTYRFQIIGGYCANSSAQALNYRNIEISDFTFLNNVTISGDNITLKSVKVGNLTGGVKTITVNAAADKTTLFDCRTEAGIVDNGTNTQQFLSHLF